MELPAARVCYRALQSRDARFDGVIIVGVTTTGVYCRPVCPARTPKPEHCRFFASAAAAQEAGFRPCLRCRPETAPDLPSWHGTSNSVLRALALINDGALDGEGATVERLAERVGLGERQLRRLFMQHLGASPIAVAQTQRVLFAKHLIHETRMPMTEVAMAAGFGSMRRFNETFLELFRRPPGALRRKTTGNAVPHAGAGVTLRLRYRPPYDWESMLAFLRARAIPGVELIEGNTYWRTVEIHGKTGSIEVAHLPERQSLRVTIRFPETKALPAIVSRVRRFFDLGADIGTIGEHLSRDPLLAPLVARRPGLRAPGGWDGFEVAVRAILGQQVSVGAARKLAAQLVAAHGGRVAAEYAGIPALTHVFPTAKRLAMVERIELGMPAARLRSLRSLATVVAADPALFRPLGTMDAAVAKLKTIDGVGEWTAHYIALRAMRETDAFPASDIGLLRSVARMGGERPTCADLLSRAELWRPWRAYAAQHLWTADANAVAPAGARGEELR